MTPLEKLKALAAAKKQAQFQEEVTPNTEANLELRMKLAAEKVNQDENVPSAPTESNQTKPELSQDKAEQGSEVCSDEELDVASGDLEEGTGSLDAVSEPNPGSKSNLADDHPLKMQLAELEQALTEKLPEFRTILRDIHAKLRQDPDCVTAMSEDEIGSIVQGLIHHANVDVIAPRAVKSAKKASKVPVSASDL